MFDCLRCLPVYFSGHVQMSILGAMQVSKFGDLANYMIPVRLAATLFYIAPELSDDLICVSVTVITSSTPSVFRQHAVFSVCSDYLWVVAGRYCGIRGVLKTSKIS